MRSLWKGCGVVLKLVSVCLNFGGLIIGHCCSWKVSDCVRCILLQWISVLCGREELGLMSSKLLHPSPVAVHFHFDHKRTQRRTLNLLSVSLSVSSCPPHTRRGALFSLLLALKITAPPPISPLLQMIWMISALVSTNAPLTRSSAMSLIPKTPLSLHQWIFISFVFGSDAIFSEVDNCPPSNMSSFQGAHRKLCPNEEPSVRAAGAVNLEYDCWPLESLIALVSTSTPSFFLPLSSSSLVLSSSLSPPQLSLMTGQTRQTNRSE